MKNVKKIFAILLVVVMTFALASTALAVDVTINGSADEYQAFQLMTAKSALTCTNTDTDHTHNDRECYTYDYTVNTKYSSVIQSVTETSSDAAAIDAISQYNDAQIRDFADAIYVAIVGAGLTADKTTSEKTFAVSEGYWLIAETELDSSNTKDTYSRIMLDTAGKNTVTIKAKEADAPTVDKTVDNAKATDAAIGDTVSYTLTGTLPENYSEYKTYSYKFTDTLAAGLTRNNDVKVMVGSSDITSSCTISSVDSDGVFTVSIEDLKTAAPSATKDSTIVVTYTAAVNDSAVTGSAGNKNSVTITYPNNPSGSGEGTSVPSEVEVYTYKVVVNKVDANNAALAGAGFTLYKWDGEQYVQIGNEIKGTDAAPMTQFVWNGLDAGQYKIHESTIPDGYHPAADVEFKIVATIEGTALTGLTVTDLAGTAIDGEDDIFTVTLNDGSAVTAIMNTTFGELPETGGTGTMIFYIAGGFLFAAAALILITKKRAGCED